MILALYGAGAMGRELKYLADYLCPLAWSVAFRRDPLAPRRASLAPRQVMAAPACTPAPRRFPRPSHGPSSASHKHNGTANARWMCF